MWSLEGQVARLDPKPPVTFVGEDTANDTIRAVLDRTECDFVASVFWPRKLPADIVGHAHLGTTNFHPAMLPHYKGPSPVSGMILADDLATGAGVTLHLMDETLDTGPIIAQARLPQAACKSTNDMRTAIGSAMYLMARDALPDWAAGQITPTPQKPGGSWAGLGPKRLTTDWPAEKLLRIAGMMQSARQDRFEITIDGQVHQIPCDLRHIGPKTEEAPKWIGQVVTFDCADARIEARPRRTRFRALKRVLANRALEREGVTEGVVIQRGHEAPGAAKH